jgi:hypothetical protein
MKLCTVVAGAVASFRKATTITASLHWVTLCTGKQLEIDKTPDGYIICPVVVVIRRECQSTGITSDFKKFAVIFPVLRESQNRWSSDDWR